MRGLGNPHTIRALKMLLRAQDPNLVFLTETKKKKQEMTYICFDLSFGDCFIVGRVGKQGGSLPLC